MVYTRVWNLSNTQEPEIAGPYRAAGVAMEVCVYVYIYIGQSLYMVY